MFKWFCKNKSEPENKSGFKLSQRSLDNLKGVHPLLVDLVKKTIKESSVDFGILHNGGLRTAEMQLELFKKGASKLDGYNKISKHQMQPSGYGEAVDLVPYIGGSYRWEMGPCIEIAETMRGMYLKHYKNYYNGRFKIKWGGCWENFSNVETPSEQFKKYRGKFPDGPHFEMVWRV